MTCGQSSTMLLKKVDAIAKLEWNNFCVRVTKRSPMKNDVKLNNDWDIDKIHLDEIYEVEAWCHMFGISMGDLKRAIDKVGTSALKVKEYLNQQNLIS